MIWPWLRLVAAVGVLAALAWRWGSEAFLDGLRVVDPWSVAAALAIGLVTTVLSAWRWCVVARGLGLPLALGAAVPAYYRALLLNAVLPAGVLGDVHRAVRHGRRSGDVGGGVRAVVFERFAGQVVLVLVAVVVLVARPVAVDLRPGSVIGAAAALVVGAVVASRVPRVRAALRRALRDARSALLTRYALPRVALSSVVAVAGHVALFVVAARAAGCTAPLGQVVPLLVLALLAMAVPVNVGGFGPREAFLAVAFGSAGLGAAQGVATAVGYGALTLLAALPGVLVRVPRSERGEVVGERGDQARQQVPALAG
ncbi:lysylphosphatidylglycerol synthase transmembrane domain-containing protein [Actinosynnema sp. NPDC050436]|uniref:lysylphosphatidylglycerol synthase transmembrane domain-containing protein n=1 Tax=Actinosynnema sp. NPDC050436 TaxID=3155659 RepID=UPI0033E92767